MALGFIPTEELELPVHEFSEPRVVAAMLMFFEGSRWDLDVLGQQALIADDSSWLRAGHTLEISWTQERIHVVCRLNGIITDLGSCKRQLNQFQKAFQQFLQTLSEEEVQTRYAGFQQRLAELEQQTRSALQFNPLHSVLFRKDTRTTSVLFWTLLVMFLLTAGVAFASDAETNPVVRLCANWGEYTLTGEWWRIITSVFVHLGLVHLLLNLANLLLLGTLLEHKTSRGFLMFSFLACGAGGSLTSLWWHTPETLSAGASGALFGWAGILLVLIGTHSIQDDSKRTYLVSAIGLLCVSFFMGMDEAIDNASHAGGFVTGVFLGILRYVALLPEKRALKTAVFLLFFVLSGIAVAAIQQKSEAQREFIVRVQKARAFKERTLEQILEVMDVYQQFADPRISVNDRYELAGSLVGKLSTIEASSGTFKQQYLSGIDDQEFDRMMMFLVKNKAYCSLYQTMLSPGGEKLYPEYLKVKQEIDSLNYLIFPK